MHAAPRWSLAGLSALVAVVAIWGAFVLPWRSATLFAIAAVVLGLLHAVTAVLALLGHSLRVRAWRVQSWAALLFLLYATWSVFRAALYIALLYGSLGEGVAVAFALVWLIAVALLLPASLWGLVWTGGIAGRSVRMGATIVAIAAVGDVIYVSSVAAADPSAAATEVVVSEALQALEIPPSAIGVGEAVPTGAPFTCEDAPKPTVVTIMVAYAGGDASCVQAGTLDAAISKVRALLNEQPPRGPIKLDVVRATQTLPRLGSVVDALSLRPGLDGVCRGERCLMPWQLVARDAFGHHQPIPVIADLRFGVAWPELLRALEPASGELVRVETESFVASADGIAPLVRLRSPERPLDAERVQHGFAVAQDYLLTAIGEDGRFAYRVDPFSGRAFYQGFSIPRQAGTTLALCELGTDPERVRPVVKAALSMLASTEQSTLDGRAGFLSYPPGRKPEVTDLGSTALSAIAFASCRHLVGDAFDSILARLVRFLLAQQRQDGGFHARHDVRTAAPQPGPDILYAAGQAVFALVLAERLAEEGVLEDVQPDAVHTAVDRAMTYFANDYWSGFASDFFFLEENWHCLAARAALTHHRHPGYERFCRDYVEFKSRLILEADVAPELLGGYGFGNVLPPHNTPTAGFGEALAAKMALDAADGQRDERSAELMHEVLAFLLRHQWDETSCFACTRERSIVGAWSEHVGSPVIRIDFVQHAMAALGHGGKALGWR